MCVPPLDELQQLFIAFLAFCMYVAIVLVFCFFCFNTNPGPHTPLVQKHPLERFISAHIKPLPSQGVVHLVCVWVL